jgi:hypothetical protein
MYRLLTEFLSKLNVSNIRLNLIFHRNLKEKIASEYFKTVHISSHEDF